MASFTASRCCATAGTSVLVAPAQCSTRLAARPSSIRGRGGALCHAQQDDGRSPASPSTPEPAAPAAAKYQREFRSLGSQVIESNEEFENPPEEDMWEGEKFEALGKGLERYFLPVLVVLGLVCGGIAAGTYNNGADTFIQSATSDEDTMKAIPASVLQPPTVL